MADIPEHILDIVANSAEKYIRNNEDRLLAGVKSDAERQEILDNSTHNIVRDSERREFHKEIIKEAIGNFVANESTNDKPILFVFAGPSVSGKSTLRAEFDEGDIRGSKWMLM